MKGEMALKWKKVGIRNKFFSVGVVNLWDRLPRDVVDAPTL